MRNVHKIFTLVVAILAATTLFFSSCQKEQAKETFTNPNLYPSKSAFEATGNFWENSELEDLIKDGIIGSSAETALVPLVFDADLNLYSPAGYNSLEINETEEESTSEDTWFTDLQTFQTITNQKELEKYSQQIYSSKGNGVFVYEPYVENQMTREEQLEFLEAHKHNIVAKPDFLSNGAADARWTTYAPSEFPEFLWKADIATGYHPSRNPVSWLGHTGVVHTTNGDPHSNSTKNMEALGFNYSDQIKLVTFKNYWVDDNFWWQVLIYNPKGTAANRDNVVQFLDNQSTDNYDFTGKNDWTKWYCSKLAWRAYKSYMGCDLDYNGGYWVLPADVANAALAQTTDARAFNFYT